MFTLILVLIHNQSHTAGKKYNKGILINVTAGVMGMYKMYDFHLMDKNTAL